jgi:hypothetical protein
VEKDEHPSLCGCYELNPKWYLEILGSVAPINDLKVKEGFCEAILKII